MSLAVVAARRAAPLFSRAGLQQARWAHSSHFDTFGVDPNNKRQTYIYYAAIIGTLSLPVFAVRYQVKKMREDKRRF
ncbi:hypothetical protein EW145_g4619 [Phellinidium pouzarii]|uniref:Uncharacterized protein n=1 Tax=Phellinidium pouzarii TaxID=167371 RepID=A0A4S4L308_9AGAM|nr:hypothetical protein EW145_g4619 [Phellinidium pouzarii]